MLEFQITLRPLSEAARVGCGDRVRRQRRLEIRHHPFHRRASRRSFGRSAVALLRGVMFRDPCSAAFVGSRTLMFQCDDQGRFRIRYDADIRPGVLAYVLFVGIDLNKGLAGSGQRKNSGRLLVQSAADHDDEIRLFRDQRTRMLVRVREIADVIGMTVGESILAFVRSEYRDVKLFRKIDQLRSRTRILSARAGEQHRLLGRVDAPDHLFDQFGVRIGPRRRIGIDHGDVGILFQHVPGKRNDHRPGTTGARQVKGPRHDARNMFGLIDLDHPLGDAAEEVGIVDLLPRLSAPSGPRDLSHQKH